MPHSAYFWRSNQTLKSNHILTDADSCLSSHWCIIRIWWRHQMKTYSVLLAINVGNSPVTRESPTQRQMTRSFEVFFDLRLHIYGWVNNGEAGDTRHHCDITVMNEHVPYRASKHAITNPQHMQVKVQSLPLVMFYNIHLCSFLLFKHLGLVI